MPCLASNGARHSQAQRIERGLRFRNDFLIGTGEEMVAWRMRRSRRARGRGRGRGDLETTQRSSLKKKRESRSSREAYVQAQGGERRVDEPVHRNRRRAIPPVTARPHDLRLAPPSRGFVMPDRRDRSPRGRRAAWLRHREASWCLTRSGRPASGPRVEVISKKRENLDLRGRRTCKHRAVSGGLMSRYIGTGAGRARRSRSGRMISAWLRHRVASSCLTRIDRSLSRSTICRAAPS
jgi:hypothetical protein